MLKRMAIFLIIIGSIALIVGLLLALKTMKPVDFIVIAGTIGLLITAFGLFGKALQDKNSSIKTDSIKATGELTSGKVDSLRSQNEGLKEKIDQQSNTIDTLRKENTELQTKNFELSQRISDKTLEIADYTSSMDSYVYLVPHIIEPYSDENSSNPSTDAKVTNIRLDHIGKYPVRIFGITVYAPAVEIINTTTREIVAPKFSVTINSNVIFDASVISEWNILLNTSNGMLRQNLKFRVDRNTNFGIYYKIELHDSNSKLVFSYTDPNFERQ